MDMMEGTDCWLGFGFIAFQVDGKNERKITANE